MASAIEEAMLVSLAPEPLAILIDLTVASIRDNRPLFPNALDEPVLYRHFRRAVQDGIEMLKTIERQKAGEG